MIEIEHVEEPMIGVQLEEGAYMPERAHELDDAGADLRSREDALIMAHGSHVFDTGVHIEIPRGYTGFLKSKSGLYINHGLFSTGVVDTGFSGTIKVRVTNTSNTDYYVKAGDKITQIVILPMWAAVFKKVDEIHAGERGDSGYGSTGR